ncbi:MAG: phenylacetate--CoA ligase family protein [Opitutus sp.]|nr:phenylacetate--CoA ligase family protein [Opitutus sp.]
MAALNRLIAAIAPTNRFYRPRLVAADGLAGFASLAEFSARMPFTTKDELARDQLAHPPYGTTLTFAPETYTRFHQTSGTSGRPLIWLDNADSWQWLLENWKTIWRSAGARAGDAVFFAFSFGPFLGFWTAFDSAQQLGLRTIAAGGMSSSERLHFLIAQRPRILCCTPTYALRLIDVARQEGIDLTQSGVERVMVAGEPGGSIPAVRDRIARGWPGAAVVDHHGMTEVGPVSHGTPDQPALLHVMHDRYYCEVVRPGTNEPAAPGASGELILTTLGREACPLLRYRTGDLVRPSTAPGDEPGRFALSGGILGRADDMVIVRGVNLYPAAVDAVVCAMGGLREYQVEIDRRAALPEVRIRFEPLDGTLDPSDEFSRRLRSAFQVRIEVECVSAGTLPTHEFKARRWKIVS